MAAARTTRQRKSAVQLIVSVTEINAFPVAVTGILIDSCVSVQKKTETEVVHILSSMSPLFNRKRENEFAQTYLPLYSTTARVNPRTQVISCCW